MASRTPTTLLRRTCTALPARRALSTTARLGFDSPSADSSKPRWSYTPPAMKAPFSPHVTKDPRRSEWRVNEDPEVLDSMYTRLLGRDGARMLPEEIKWLAVTHKSFDQARRGMNDRLAYLGRMAIIHECAKSITSAAPKEPTDTPDEFGRVPFSNPLLDSLDNLTSEQPKHVVSVENLERVALEVGLLKAMRWKPRFPEDLAASGQAVILSTTVAAIFGAIVLQHGSEVASRLIRDRLLARIKLMSSN
ncbi:hypothetical protein TD95_002125 [Thielaviopsis punctulata]|uniref:RNase III domain-containing protein n=1 Tax=Thielaviopsis punctulata TaxID=72032 RepID=A0A0F4Z8P0_9PEZI|nr:hypothetical protein TD95_002125 [Thielaviopsis punctulata]